MLSAESAPGRADHAARAVTARLSVADQAALDNPVWSSLTGHHQAIGLHAGALRWFPRRYAPFLAVADRSASIDAATARRDDFTHGYFLGAVPDTLPAMLSVESRLQVHQMLLDARRDQILDESGCQPLSEAHSTAMLALAGLAFPLFFRADTHRLGNYFGVFERGILVAMAGERMAFGAWREISGVCTHPEHVGRGHARRLTHALINRHRRLGFETFLHVTVGNDAALALYQRMHFSVRATLALVKIAAFPQESGPLDGK